MKFKRHGKNLLKYFVRSGNVNIEYERLFDFLLADSFRESLPPGPVQFALSKKRTECFHASAVADLANIHVNNRIYFTFPSKTSYDRWGGNHNQSGK